MVAQSRFGQSRRPRTSRLSQGRSEVPMLGDQPVDADIIEQVTGVSPGSSDYGPPPGGLVDDPVSGSGFQWGGQGSDFIAGSTGVTPGQGESWGVAMMEDPSLAVRGWLDDSGFVGRHDPFTSYVFAQYGMNQGRPGLIQPLFDVMTSAGVTDGNDPALMSGFINDHLGNVQNYWAGGGNQGLLGIDDLRGWLGDLGDGLSGDSGLGASLHGRNIMQAVRDANIEGQMIGVQQLVAVASETMHPTQRIIASSELNNVIDSYWAQIRNTGMTTGQYSFIDHLGEYAADIIEWLS